MAQEYGASSEIVVEMAGPYGSMGTAAKLVEITMPATGWKGAISPYSQEVSVEGASVSSMVELRPSAAQVEQMRASGIALMAVNDGGEVTVYAIGNKPQEHLVIQAALLEVVL